MTLPSNAAEKLHLLLAILAWLVPRGEASIEEIAQQFNLAEGEVVGIVEMAACCGVPPYSPDALLDLLIDGDRVFANLGETMGRSRQLSGPEGFALAASARAILSVQGADPDGALSSALVKLEAALGDRSRLAVELEGPPFLPTVRDALADHEQIDIEYYSSGRDEVTSRRIEPFHLFSVDGHWYLDAFCRTAGDVRHFRVDRIRNVVRTSIPVEFADAGSIPGALQSREFLRGEDVSEVMLDVPAEAEWVINTYPVRSWERIAGGRLHIVLPVSAVPWLERLLLVLGPDAHVISPADLVDTGRHAADGVLKLYK